MLNARTRHAQFHQTGAMTGSMRPNAQIPLSARMKPATSDCGYGSATNVLFLAWDRAQQRATSSNAPAAQFYRPQSLWNRRAVDPRFIPAQLACAPVMLLRTAHEWSKSLHERLC